ncbi:MAG: rod shape-determining protein MreC [Oscillospiraceae bacterium]|nr:rod shape-determining protein MreC [Oscillospiraceae bacterium]
MKIFLKKKGILVLVLVLVVALILGLTVHFRAGKAGPLANASSALRSPLARSAVAVTQWLEGVYGYLYKYDQLEEENEALRKELADAEERARLGQEAIEENEKLRELLNLAEKRSDFVFESAKIISWDSSNWAHCFTISKGSKDGIELEDAVVTEYNALVGQVVELGDNWATVRTMVDIDFGTSVLVGVSGNTAMVIGDFSLMQSGRAKLAYLTDSSTVFEEDTVITSGEGGSFPQGLMVGTVTALTTDDGGQTISGIVEPACDLDRLTQVFVIKDFEIVE